MEAATIQSITTELQGILGLLMPILITLAVVYFIWGMVQFIGKSGSEEGRTEGRQRMIWGVVGIFVIVSVWGLVGFINSSFDVGFGGPRTNVPHF